MTAEDSAVAAKPRIVHVIDSLTRGGAETLLVNLLPELAPHYDVVLVTLTPDSDFDPALVICKERHCLGYTGPASIPSCAWKLRRIIARHRPALVRSQLYVSSVVARLATPSRTPLVFSIHNPMSQDSYKANRLALPLEKLTYNARHALISVSRDALDDFDRWVGIRGSSYILYNFINPRYFDVGRVRTAVAPQVRLVAVGMLKEQKNYRYLLEAFRVLRNDSVSLDIYGEGPLRESLQQEIDRQGINVALKGKRPDIHTVLQDYDLYVMSSRYEGFGIAPVEAMATGLPLLLSDLPVLREVSHGNALFFDPTDPRSFLRRLEEVRSGAVDLATLSERGMTLARSNYSREGYVRRLLSIYQDVVQACSGAASARYP